MRYLSSLLGCLATFCLLLGSGCEEAVATSPGIDDGERYFPLELNRSVYFAVDSIVVRNTLGGVVYDTARLTARETLVEAFAGADGGEYYRGERWERASDTVEWRFRQTYTLTRSGIAARRSEDNLTFSKLVFPVRVGKRWDGNVAFADSLDFAVGGEFLDIYFDWDYEYTAAEEAVDLPTGVRLENTVLVRQAETDNLIDRRLAYERYAADIGLVERFIDARHSQCRACCQLDFERCAGLDWDQRAEKGFVLRQVFLRRD